MKEAVIVSAVRSAVARGKSDGSLASVHPIDLSAEVMKAAVTRVGVDPALIEDIQWGCAMPEASQGLNVARLSMLRAGFPVEVSAATINRFCSSGLQSVAYAAQAIISGMNEVVLAGGVEMMSQVPMSGYHTQLHPELTEAYIGMGFTAERVAERWGISRADQDAWALRSHQKALEAQARGAFDEQIVPIPVKKVHWRGSKKQVEEVLFAKDELPRADTSLERLAKLKPAFKEGGTVTAGNASPYSDGAAAVLLMSADKAKELGLKPLARFISFATGGVDPDIMGVGPIKAVPKALAKAGIALDDLKLIEFNEAFAAQVLAVMRELQMDPEKVNVNGGAIALGHPLGATGAKLTTQLIHELGKRGGGLGMVTMCIGGGMGAAGVFEVYPQA
ncbi:thiolase family protein [Meiothermus taiwanensis]|jgi:acetyl-CoA acyltransferase|uniref:acetyl-CoA C-acyltransferase n=2 Tax=Meiothermus taiwanensis TaxID=172827 RepID=A0A399DSL4_9DEIN|nr:thiolase family protein [Meiothermus taiwanensis]AWR86045.1 acetyl-CoA acetyltransferase [Meiothermus taiwanensis WR-220]KIQ55217.1 acetyl-CoA acetyltransferase [Meiothermus taiwanensis]KZK14915.1 acetyl-CoA acetyltransferase [Meiothermus taiwanensis]RIH75215.1 3-ketoacyl-CoA thiolase [Meiothermus taiwanensis]